MVRADSVSRCESTVKGKKERQERKDKKMRKNKMRKGRKKKGREDMIKGNKKERERTYVPQWDNEKNTDQKLKEKRMRERVSGVDVLRN
jgi:hypothetical protein